MCIKTSLLTKEHNLYPWEFQWTVGRPDLCCESTGIFYHIYLYMYDISNVITNEKCDKFAMFLIPSCIHEDERGVNPEVEFIFDLKLPEDFVPVNADGEVQGFKLYPVSEVSGHF
jgi:hypothetical protein